MLLVYDPAVGRVDYDHNKGGKLRGAAALTLTKQRGRDVSLRTETPGTDLGAVKHLDVGIIIQTKKNIINQIVGL